MSYTTGTAMSISGIWLLIWLNAHTKEASSVPLCVRISVTSSRPTSNQLAIYVVNDTLYRLSFIHAWSYCLILLFYCEIKLKLLLL